MLIAPGSWAVPLLAVAALSGGSAHASTGIASCLDERDPVRVARVVGPDGAIVHAKVVAHQAGVPIDVAPVGPAQDDLSAAFDRAADLSDDAPVWRIDASEKSARICSPVQLGQDEIDDESRVVVAAGLNYAAHADEAGGGDVFVFPKPSAPTAPYTEVAAPAGVTLLDYEVELAFVLLEDVDLRALPTRDELLARSAFFVSNDVSDREPIIAQKPLVGISMGFLEAKGQPGFLPAGPWLVRGTELFAAMEACGADGLGIGLDVDEGDGFLPRQDATTAAMILRPEALLARIAEQVEREGAHSPMPVGRADGVRHYPFAVEDRDGGVRLPAGSLVLTGTPEGVALNAPEILPLLGRGLLRFRGPIEQFRQEELARAAAGEPGGYLAPGDRVRGRIDGLGTQIFRVAEPGADLRPDPCGAPSEVLEP